MESYIDPAVDMTQNFLYFIHIPMKYFYDTMF